MDGTLQDYAEVVGQEIIDELHVIAERVKHLSLQNINSTSVGGGVAEILDAHGAVAPGTGCTDILGHHQGR